MIIKRNKKGFTLIEMIVSMTLFTLIIITWVRLTSQYFDVTNSIWQSLLLQQTLSWIEKQIALSSTAKGIDLLTVTDIKNDNLQLTIVYKDVLNITTSRTVLIAEKLDATTYSPINYNYFTLLQSNNNYKDLYVIEQDQNFNKRILGKFDSMLRISNLQFTRYWYQNVLWGYWLSIKLKDHNAELYKFKLFN